MDHTSKRHETAYRPERDGRRATTAHDRRPAGAAAPRWLGRYEDPRPIRARGAFHLVAARRASDGEPCTVLVPGPEPCAAGAAEAFTDIERAHASARGPCVPAVAAKGVFEETPFLELDCDAVMDGVELHRRMIEARQRVPLGAADAFASTLRGALSAAHHARGPEGEPVCLGRLSYANLLFSPSGRFFLVGLGRNFPVERPSGLPDGWVTTFEAPEVALGGAPSPAGDLVALHLLLRSLLPLLDPGPVLARLLSGEAGTEAAEVLDCLRWPDIHLCAAPPSRRGSPAESAAVSRRLRALCGITPDPDAFEALVRLALESAAPPPSPDGQRTLVLGMETSWMLGADGERHVLGQAHRRIVTALAELHRRSPGGVLTVQQILEAGWPGERMIPEAGANRVYVALTHLRRMGLRDLVERREGGYRLVTDARIRFS